MPKKCAIEYLPTFGVRADFKRFMNQFLAKKTVRFEHFSEIWRERNMSYLCAGRVTDREAREFVEKVMLIAQDYFLPSYQFQVRVGGLYLLYAIYQIQPLVPKVKIRMTPTQWQETLVFQQQAAQDNHLDVVYIFQWLLHEQAFLFCYTPAEMTVHSSIRDGDDGEENLADTLREEKSAVTKLCGYESLEKLSYLQKHYQEMKISLAGEGATKPDKSLDVVQGELVQDIVGLLELFKEKVASLSKKDQKSEGTSQETESEVQTTGSRRQMLKAQALSQLGTQTNKRHNLVVANSSCTSPAKAVPSEAAVSSKMSWKEIPTSITRATKKPVPVTNLDEGSSPSDSDEDYVPPGSLSQSKKKAREKNRQEDKKLSQKKPQPSMPVLEISDTDRHCLPTWQTSSESTSTVMKYRGLENMAPVRKRGRPSLASSISGKVISNIFSKPPFSEPIKKSQTEVNHASSNDSNNGSQSDEDQNSSRNKIAFNWKKPGKKMTLQETEPSHTKGSNNSDEIVINATKPAKKRGRPRMIVDPLTVIPTEVVVYPKTEIPKKPGKQKYEIVYFPAGMTQAAEVIRAECSIPNTGSDTLSQAVKQMTSKVRQNKRATKEGITSPTSKKTTEIAAPKPALQNTTKIVQRRGRRATLPRTITEVVVRKEVGKPAVIESLTSADKTEHPIPRELAKTPQNSSTSSIAQQNSSSAPVKAPTNSRPVNDEIQRLRERCKRKREEADLPDKDFMKRSLTQEMERSLVSSDDKSSLSDMEEQTQTTLTCNSKNTMGKKTLSQKQTRLSDQKCPKTFSVSNLSPWTLKGLQMSAGSATSLPNNKTMPRSKGKSASKDSLIEYRFL